MCFIQFCNLKGGWSLFYFIVFSEFLAKKPWQLVLLSFFVYFINSFFSTPKPWYSGGGGTGGSGTTAEIPRVKANGNDNKPGHGNTLKNRDPLSLNLYNVDDSRRYSSEPKPYIQPNTNRYTTPDPRQQVSTNYLRPNLQRGSSNYDRKSNVPRPDYSPTMPRALKVHNNIIDDDQMSARSGRSGRSNGLRRY